MHRAIRHNARLDVVVPIRLLTEAERNDLAVIFHGINGEKAEGRH